MMMLPWCRCPYPDNSPGGQFPTVQVLVLMSGFIPWQCLVGSCPGGEQSQGLWTWWAMVGLYFYLVGNCPSLPVLSRSRLIHPLLPLLRHAQFLTAGDGKKYIINEVQTVLQPAGSEKRPEEELASDQPKYLDLQKFLNLCLSNEILYDDECRNDLTSI